jgi:periplasmic protein TonB
MNFQALLFCQDEKTARVTTQLLTELEFSVESSTEPFAAVKKLMGQHFHAVVVDCDNEQNASLLFKGARNSTLNQSSLAVAVVDGQTGVANAFRIGANLVLTKPINVEQAKGTLRVARGLLKKGGESAKAAAPAPPAAQALPSASALPAASAPPAARPPAASADKRPTPPFEAVSKRAFTPPSAKPVAVPAMAKTNSDPGNVLDLDSDSAEPAEEILLDGLDEHVPSAKPAGRTEPIPTGTAPTTPKPEAQRPLTVPVLSLGRAASAPAPAKVLANPEFEKIGDPATGRKRSEIHASAAGASSAAPGLFAQRQSVPTFAGLDAVETEKSGAGKFVMIAIAVLALATAGYFGYTKLNKRAPRPLTRNQQEPAAVPETGALPPSSPSTSITSPAAAQKSTPSVVQEKTASTPPAPHKSETAKASDEEPEVVVTEIKPAPRVVRANPTKPTDGAKTKDTEEEAPSLVGATSGDESTISNIVTSAPVGVPTAAPSEMLKVSQGVTQGLLLKRVQPVYPHTAMQMRIAGSVQLQAIIDKTGSISSVKMLSGDPILARAAAEAVRQWKYKPYMLDGEPVDIQTQITVNFKLP